VRSGMQADDAFCAKSSAVEEVRHLVSDPLTRFPIGPTGREGERVEGERMMGTES